MSFNQTRDILDHACEFHERLVLFYDQLKDRARSAETRNLINELIDHEFQLEQRLKAYEEMVSGDIIDTYFKYMLDGGEVVFSRYEIPERVDSNFVINATRYFDDCLRRFYEGMAQKALSERVREILENLQDFEQREEKVLSKLLLDVSMA